MIEGLLDIKDYKEENGIIQIKLCSFDNLEQNEKVLFENGFKFKEKKERIFYYQKNNVILSISFQTHNIESSRLMPDYTNSMVNLTSSIRKYYGVSSDYDSSKKLDKYLDRDYKHIMFLILDGLGPYIIKSALEPGDILYDNLKEIISAVFPPTTACAIPCSASGKLALETAWLGWENYIKEINRNVVLFTGENYSTGQSTGINIRKTYLPYDDYFDLLGVSVKDLEPSFRPDGYETFDDLLNGFKKHIKEKERTFTYAYWTEPDSTLHEYGVFSKEANEMIKRLDDSLKKSLKDIDDDTLIIITADHGHQNVIPVKFYNYKELSDMLERMPSNEGRSLTFKVKPQFKNRFKELFNHYFSDYYDLYSKEEFLAKGFLGDIERYGYNKRLDDFLADYIAIANNELYFEYVNKEDFHFKAAHAGITQNEMETPLIIIKK